MENYSFLRKMLFESTGKTTLIILNQKQFKGSLTYITNYLCKEVDSKIILILTSISAEYLIREKEITNIPRENLVIIDLASGKNGEEQIDGFKVIFLENPSNLTQFEIILENLSIKEPERKIIVFESLSGLNSYISQERLEKFAYFFVNRLGLESKTGIIISVKNNTTKLELIEQFFDKIYDFSTLALANVEKII